MARTAVVTGGAGGIGGAIVDVLKPGHDVRILDREQLDLADAEQVRRAADDIGHCDVFVHAAAAFDHADLASLDLETWRRVQAVNVESGLLLAQAFAPGMATAGWGRIVLITSNTAAHPPLPHMLPYVASKSALEGAMRVLALDLGRSGITVNAVAPGLTRTPAAEAGMSPGEFDAVRNAQAIPRTLEPEDIAGAVAFLASDAAGAITGQTICVDGGVVFR